IDLVPGYGIEMVKTTALFPLCGVSNSRLETEKNHALCPMPYALCPMPPSPKDLFSKPYLRQSIDRTQYPSKFSAVFLGVRSSP
ncbi:MAG: hypothetical protein MUE44_27445, partial [Oscillatoriaceae cyanobacterium Prado104]|nr:hypothetical protein [Oscillatoriaceae cyanobacterium Prado104]